MLVVDRPGALALLQDLGRPGYAHLGVSPSGAADRAAHRLANRLVGNPESCATVETVLGGLVLTATELTWVAVTGAATEVVVNRTPTSSHTSLVLGAGDRLTITPPAQGLRNYLAVRGGFLAELVLGSRSTDVLSGLGPAPLTAGQQLATGHSELPLPDTDRAPARTPTRTLAVTPGPRADWFQPQAWSALLDRDWTVTADADRVAVRLEGPALDRRVHDELPSEGLIRGAVQVPSSGQPLIFGADHPVTGGYPVIAVLTSRAVDAAAQLRPGDRVRFGR